MSAAWKSTSAMKKSRLARIAATFEATFSRDAGSLVPPPGKLRSMRAEIKRRIDDLAEEGRLSPEQRAEIRAAWDAFEADYAQAMAEATARAIPEEMVRVGLPYVRALLAAHRIDDAVSVNGRIAPWADRDMRAAWSAALVYTALGQAEAATNALERARQLAGERNLRDVIAVKN